MKPQYKVIYSSPITGPQFLNFSRADNYVFDEHQAAKERMMKIGEEIADEYASMHMTKADIFKYRVADGTEFRRDLEDKAIVLQIDTVQFTTQPIAYLQIIEI